MCRPDLLRAVGSLATYLTRWSREEDAKLHRMMCYINCSKHHRQVAFIGDEPKDLYLALFTDSDLAGDRRDMKSTSGVFLALVGPNTFFPLGSMSKKQTAVSHSSTEAELVAMDVAVREEGIPALGLWTTFWDASLSSSCSRIIRIAPPLSPRVRV